MSTRGLVGFVVDGEEKLGYNHSDSYPGGVGADVLRWLKSLEGAKLGEARDAAKALVVIADEDETPTPEQRAALARYSDPHVGGPMDNTEVRNWYQALRHTQGDPAAMLDAGFLVDYRTFAADSLFCEWAYVVDFDASRLEVYEGFQEQPHRDGRFADTTGEVRRYYPVRLVAAWSLEQLPDEGSFVRSLERDDDED